MEEMKSFEMIEFAKQINQLVDERVKKVMEEKAQQDTPYQSAETAELITALAKAYLEYPAVTHNKSNSYLKSGYADFDAIMAVIRPVLAKNGLVLNQFTTVNPVNSAKTLHTQICHSSGQWKESRERIIPMKADDHSWASTVSYKKRHQAMALLNITISEDSSDDDAETNMKTARQQEMRGTATNHTYSNADQPYETVNVHEHGQLNQALQGWPDLCKLLLENYKISSLADLPRAKYAHVIRQIRTNIEQRKKGTTTK